jgi:hypothetical protein
MEPTINYSTRHGRSDSTFDDSWQPFRRMSNGTNPRNDFVAWRARNLSRLATSTLVRSTCCWQQSRSRHSRRMASRGFGLIPFGRRSSQPLARVMPKRFCFLPAVKRLVQNSCCNGQQSVLPDNRARSRARTFGLAYSLILNRLVSRPCGIWASNLPPWRGNSSNVVVNRSRKSRGNFNAIVVAPGPFNASIRR